MTGLSFSKRLFAVPGLLSFLLVCGAACTRAPETPPVPTAILFSVTGGQDLSASLPEADLGQATPGGFLVRREHLADLRLGNDREVFALTEEQAGCSDEGPIQIPVDRLRRAAFQDEFSSARIEFLDENWCRLRTCPRECVVRFGSFLTLHKTQDVLAFDRRLFRSRSLRVHEVGASPDLAVEIDPEKAGWSGIAWLRSRAYSSWPGDTGGPAVGVGKRFAVGEWIQKAVFSPCGRHAMALSGSGEIFRLDLASGVHERLRIAGVIDVCAPAFGDRDAWILTGTEVLSIDEQGQVRDRIRNTAAAKARIESMAGGNELLICSADEISRLDIATGEKKNHRIEGNFQLTALAPVTEMLAVTVGYRMFIEDGEIKNDAKAWLVRLPDLEVEPAASKNILWLGEPAVFRSLALVSLRGSPSGVVFGGLDPGQSELRCGKGWPGGFLASEGARDLICLWYGQDFTSPGGRLWRREAGQPRWQTWVFPKSSKYRVLSMDGLRDRAAVQQVQEILEVVELPGTR